MTIDPVKFEDAVIVAAASGLVSRGWRSAAELLGRASPAQVGAYNELSANPSFAPILARAFHAEPGAN